MTDFLPDTPDYGVRWCPGCEPDRDPTVEILVTQWCDTHTRPEVFSPGADDERAQGSAYLSGNIEAGGDNNRRWCEFFHQGRTSTPEKASEPEPPPIDPSIS